MNRKSFLRNALMALSISLLPKVLQPMEVVLVNDDEIYGDYEYNLIDSYSYSDEERIETVALFTYTLKQKS